MITEPLPFHLKTVAKMNNMEINEIIKSALYSDAEKTDLTYERKKDLLLKILTVYLQDRLYGRLP